MRLSGVHHDGSAKRRRIQEKTRKEREGRTDSFSSFLTSNKRRCVAVSSDQACCLFRAVCFCCGEPCWRVMKEKREGEEDDIQD